MSTDSLRRPPDNRALDARPAWRWIAASLWCGFLGAALAVVTVQVAWPEVVGGDLGALSETFLVAWLLATIPAALAYWLGAPPVR